MKLKHKVKINIAERNGHKQEVLQSEHRNIPKRLLTFLFGEFCEVLVLTPGETVQGMPFSKMNTLHGQNLNGNAKRADNARPIHKTQPRKRGCVARTEDV